MNVSTHNKCINRIRQPVALLAFAKNPSKQLTSYAGYDIVLRESGTWRGRSRISKKGNSHIRRALHMPSLCAKTYSQTYYKFYNRINDRKQNGLVSAVAVQRKLLGLIYTLSKNDAAYIENH